MPVTYAVDFAHWPWPIGWGWNNGVVGNIVASAVWVALAGAFTLIMWPAARRAVHHFVDRKLAAWRHHAAEHEAWTARHLAEIYRSATGREPDDHPHGHDLNTPYREESGTMPTDTGLKKGLTPFDPAKHARFRTAASYGFALPAPSYPIDKTHGIMAWGMCGNGPDQTLSVNGGRPVGDCGVAAVPAHAGMLAAALAGLDLGANTMSSDDTVRLYFTYQAELAGIAWRPPAAGTAWTQADMDQAAQLDLGVDLGDWLLWLFKNGYVEGFVAVDKDHLDAALDHFEVVIVGVDCNPQIDQQFGSGQPFDVGPGDEPDPNEGHAILYLKAQSPTGPYAWCTWGATWPSTDAWRNACVRQAFAVVTRQEAEAKGFVDQYDRMLADLRQMAGTVVPDAPPPAPPAPPTPAPQPGPAPQPPEAGDTIIRRIDQAARAAITRIEDVAAAAIRQIISLEHRMIAGAEGDGVLPPLPKWTDPGSVALFLTAVLGNIIAIWSLAAPWDPRWSAAAQAAIPIASFVIAAAALYVNVYIHHKTVQAAHERAHERAMLREAIQATSRPGPASSRQMPVDSPGGRR